MVFNLQDINSMRLFLKLFIILISVKGLPLPVNENTAQENLKSVYILKHEWHVGFILKKSDTVGLLSALNDDFNEAKYIEIGWGDKDFYMAEKETVWLSLKAALWPTPSVLHVAEVNTNPMLLFDEGEIIELELKTDNYRNLCSYINKSFELTSEGNNIEVGKGLYGNSTFYLSQEKYHLFQTCNVWAAKGLQKGKVSIKPYKAITSNNVMKQLQKKYN